MVPSSALVPSRNLRCIATVSLSGTLPDKLEAAARIGFEGVEIFENDLLTYSGTPQSVREQAEWLGLKIVLYQPFRDFEAMPDPQRQCNLDRAERKFDIMEALGTDLVLVCSNVQSACLDDDSRAAADLAEMAERAARRGLRVGYEALAWGRHVKTWGHAWKIVQQADHPALGLIVDSFHTLAIGDDPSGLAKLPGERIFFVQLADAPRVDMDVLSLSHHLRNFPGQGELPVGAFLRAVLDSGYSGPVSLEIFNDDFRAAPARLIARDGLRSLVLAEASAGAVDLPAPPLFDGFEFVEFAMDEDPGRELEEFLRTLGFRHAGHHRSKSVDLFRQGRANLVLNADPDSAAWEYFRLHGPSVCAIALRVDDPRRAVARAEALLSPEWHARTGVGEREIPAIRAPDGTLVYLVGPDPTERSIWQDDFNLFAGGKDNGIAAIDHVAQALPAGRMDAFVLFWRAVFGLELAQLWQIPDPFGLIQSRALVSADGSIRVPLNVSVSCETSTGRFTSAYAGAGVQHLAFGTADIFATIGALAGLGAPILTIPTNYYDDLGARFGLSDERLAQLREHNVLYDRDDQGEFLHAYTDGFHDRFFFEVVQRIDGYGGFGVANAFMRISAQLQKCGSGRRSLLI